MKLKILLLVVMMSIVRMVQSQTVVDIIVNSPDHDTLEAAVVAAGLAGTLSGEGPFTVFAPTDDAFGALPAGTIEALLNDIPLLTSILTYHVAGVNALSTDLSNGQEVVTLNGESVTVTINAEGVFINDAKVTVADLVATNGVVHVIDAVLLPPAASNTVVDVTAGGCAPSILLLISSSTLLITKFLRLR
ncbi:MAG: fasciclin domain-containing protein [Saprospiraceae bacterium]|nr:fasciclin domain-containing protein [Saprospiraceae bacterium]